MATGNAMLNSYGVAERIEMDDARKRIITQARIAYATCMIVSSYSKCADVTQRNVSILAAHAYMLEDKSLNTNSLHALIAKKIQPML